ncbi:sirohydrochlorin nickelochelatase [Methanophagales archaeon]|nr:MAG: sirohydrochlorin nickelochelatase [Methanophagales archaeon]
MTGEEDIAVVLIGHGSRLPYGKEVMEELRRRLEMRAMFKVVRTAFMQINTPSIEDALRELARSGIKNIIALPVFLADGAHTKEDIPEKLKAAFAGEWAEIGRGVNLIYGKPIGVDERIVDILIDRVKEAAAARQ